MTPNNRKVDAAQSRIWEAWPAELWAQCLRMKAAGATHAQIGDAIGRTAKAVRNKFGREGATTPTPKRGVHKGIMKHIEADPSLSSATIAKELNCTASYVSAFRRGSSAGSRSTNKRARTYGPYATPEGRLNDEGRAFLDEWLSRYPRPIALFRAVFRKAFVSALASGLDPEEINGLCMEGVVSHLLWFQPSRGCQFQSLAVYAMLSKVCERSINLSRPRKHGFKFMSGNVPSKLNEGKTDFFSEHGTWDQGIIAIDAADESRFLNERIRDILCRHMQPRERELFLAHHGLIDGERQSFSQLGKSSNLTGAGVAYLIKQAHERIDPYLEELYLDHCWEGAAA